MNCACFLAVALLALSGAPCAAQMPGGTGRADLAHGEFKQVYEAEVGPEGGTLAIPKTDGVLDGLEIEVPAGALTARQKLAFGHARGVFKGIRGGTEEVVVIRISPFQATASGNGYTDKPVSLKIPSSDAAGMAMVFCHYFDEKTRRIDVAPVTPSEDGKFLVMVTRHFNTPIFFKGLSVE